VTPSRNDPQQFSTRVARGSPGGYDASSRGYAPPPSRYSPAVQTASSASTGTRLSPEPTPVTPRNVASRRARRLRIVDRDLSVAAVFDVLDVALCEAVAEPRARSALDERGEGRVRARSPGGSAGDSREAERTRGSVASRSYRTVLASTETKPAVNARSVVSSIHCQPSRRARGRRAGPWTTILRRGT